MNFWYKKQRKTNLQFISNNIFDSKIKLIKMGFFIIKIHHISSSNDPNTTHTKNRIWGLWHAF